MYSHLHKDILQRRECRHNYTSGYFRGALSSYPRAYIAKTIYRTGGPQSKEIYIGKILIDVKGKVVKEYYDQRALDDPALVNSEFGKSIEHLTSITPLINKR